MVAALALRHERVQVALLEAESQDRIRPGSRAIFFHSATLKLLEEIKPGLGFAFAEKGIIWRTKRTLYRARKHTPDIILHLHPENSPISRVCTSP
ncbi:hypothetical protein QTN31_16385 [Alicyclobacillus cycloheptanicus]|uniref:2-polyprenyl-6-methoxyphenol hydroxylase-like FAD-dependent oxidoreductase n=1 Tax=Alicyclobacillus cycloheptanicus TaxID=1457 RepID=A0ABT9XMC3_9BACL|nr:hypothetical protein [Alicyclobacillus cycloheptanicus]MDQ0191469.1 2-polyprenyl-6-methoxyphenol hydroxylase-like FAD-dependent oxidoreductase [Alicyclobacillus cycloheptanicus]